MMGKTYRVWLEIQRNSEGGPGCSWKFLHIILFIQIPRCQIISHVFLSPVHGSYLVTYWDELKGNVLPDHSLTIRNRTAECCWFFFFCCLVPRCYDWNKCMMTRERKLCTMLHSPILKKKTTFQPVEDSMQRILFSNNISQYKVTFGICNPFFYLRNKHLLKCSELNLCVTFSSFCNSFEGFIPLFPLWLLIGDRSAKGLVFI